MKNAKDQMLDEMLDKYYDRFGVNFPLVPGMAPGTDELINMIEEALRADKPVEEPEYQEGEYY